MAGVQIGSHVNQWNLDALELLPFFAAAERLGASVFVHPWDMPTERMTKYWMPWLVGASHCPVTITLTHAHAAMPSETTVAVCCVILGGLLEKHPNLKICFAHGCLWRWLLSPIPWSHAYDKAACSPTPSVASSTASMSAPIWSRPTPNSTRGLPFTFNGSLYSKKSVSGREFLGKIWSDSLVHDPDALKLLVSVIGEVRVDCNSTAVRHSFIAEPRDARLRLPLPAWRGSSRQAHRLCGLPGRRGQGKAARGERTRVLRHQAGYIQTILILPVCVWSLPFPKQCALAARRRGPLIQHLPVLCHEDGRRQAGDGAGLQAGMSMVAECDHTQTWYGKMRSREPIGTLAKSMAWPGAASTLASSCVNETILRQASH